MAATFDNRMVDNGTRQATRQIFLGQRLADFGIVDLRQIIHRCADFLAFPVFIADLNQAFVHESAGSVENRTGARAHFHAHAKTEFKPIRLGLNIELKH